ncbi:MAG: HAD-IIB family hydrolase [Nanoarchaeota archaeon]
MATLEGVQALIADIDGVLTEGGKLSVVDSSLRKAIQDLRAKGILFSLASGRPFFEQEEFHRLMIAPDHYKEGEAILYEASSVLLLGREEIYRLGGLTREQIKEIEAFASQQKLFVDMVRQANGDKYETTTGYVTSTFVTEGRTNIKLLEKTYHRVKPILEKRFPFSEVCMSADAIDVYAKGINKAKPLQKYAEITGISLDQMVVIGDSGNDMPMFELVGRAGGLAVYVGTNPEQERIVRGYTRHYISQQKGICGTIESLHYLLAMKNKQ